MCWDNILDKDLTIDDKANCIDILTSLVQSKKQSMANVAKQIIFKLEEARKWDWIEEGVDASNIAILKY